jgi:selenide,water dikinase
MSAALKKGELHDKAYRQLLETTTQLNTPGIALAEMPGVHALTDVTGFGLLGHLLGICRGSNVKAELGFEAIPVLSAARHLVQQGFATGASDRNWSSYQHEVTLPAGAPGWQRKLLTDPQTSGGLLVACEAASAPAVLEIFRQQGFRHAAQIGRLVTGAPEVTVV